MSKVGDHTLGFGEESTVGTAIAPSARIEVVNESLKLTVERIESKGLKAGRRFLSSNGWAAGKKSVEGDIEVEIPSNGFGTLLKHLLGTVATTTPAGATTRRLHTITSGDLNAKSLTFEVARTDVAGTSHKFTYNGCAIMDCEIACGVGDYATAKLTIDGWNETVSAASATSASYPTGTPLVFTGAAITIAGSSVPVTQFSCKIATGRKADRYFLGSSLKSQQVESDMRMVDGKIDVEWTGLTQYQRFVNGTTAAIVAKFETQDVIESTVKGYLEITIPVARFDGETPNGGGEIVKQSVDFMALDNGTDEPITIKYLSLDTSV